jgi:hypothetical protein
MAARNELLRQDGRHTAHEFLDKIEGHLVTRPALDSEAAEKFETMSGDTKRATWSTLAPNATGTESSAWVPAARPTKEGEE